MPRPKKIVSETKVTIEEKEVLFEHPLAHMDAPAPVPIQVDYPVGAKVTVYPGYIRIDY